MKNSSCPPVNLKGKGNPDLPSVCSNYWPPIIALSLCFNHLVLLTFWQFQVCNPTEICQAHSQYYVITHNSLIPIRPYHDGCTSAPSLMLWYIILFLSYHGHSLKSADSNLVVKNKYYRGSSLSTFFGIWKKLYYAKFVLVVTTWPISTSTNFTT